MCAEINSFVAAAEEMDQVVKIQSEEFADAVEIVAPGRKLLKRGELKKKNRRGGYNQYTFFLFNDAIMYASAGISVKLVHHQTLLLREVTLSRCLWQAAACQSTLSSLAAPKSPSCARQ